MKYPLLSIVFLSPLVVSAAHSDYLLGTIYVKGNLFNDQFSEQGQYQLTDLAMSTYPNFSINEAAKSIPGVNLNFNGARNESSLSIRGFDSRQVPVLVDGIPISLPYDGNIDLGRIGTFDLASVEVTKGNVSPLLGPNSMGGAINLVTRRPSKKLEGFAVVDTFFNQGVSRDMVKTGIGGKYEQWYYQVLAAQAKNRDLVPSKDYEGSRPLPHSSSKDQKLSAKLAWTPNAVDEYSFNYTQERASKDLPTYQGPLSTVQKRYWTYPIWNKRAHYFLSKTKLTEFQSVKSRLFYNTYDNTLDSYDNATYSTQNTAKAFRSTYDDDAMGGQLEHLWESNKWSIAQNLHYKRDHHREYNRDEAKRHFIDDFYTYGIEGNYYFDQGHRLAMGSSYEWRDGRRAEDYNSTTKVISDYKDSNNRALNPSISYLYQLNSQLGIKATVAKKTRFPTMKDRYSYRLNKSIPNPDLKQEEAILYEVSSLVKIDKTFNGEFSAFHYDIDQTLLSVNVDPTTTQVQNTGKSITSGVEASSRWQLFPSLSLNGSYLYLRKKDKSGQDLLFTDSPRHHGTLAVEYSPIDRWSLHSALDAYSSRFTDTAGTQRVSGHYLLNFSTHYQFLSGVSLSGGILNLLDRYYELSSGYPERGREFYLEAKYQF